MIHLGHDRSVEEVVNTAIQEDANAIALTSYQGGHNEYFKYMYDLLHERGASHIKIFGGGGGVILPSEIKDLMDYGITRIYAPDDGRALGLQGMINDLVALSDFPIGDTLNGEVNKLSVKEHGAIARLISSAENFPEVADKALEEIHIKNKNSAIPVLGITGTGGAGKSSLVDELVRRFLIDFPEKTIGIISIDPSKRKTGGALLGDRIRMEALAEDAPDVVLSDVVMPGMSGFDLSRKIKEGMGEEAPAVVLLTSLADPLDIALPAVGAATMRPMRAFSSFTAIA